MIFSFRLRPTNPLHNIKCSILFQRGLLSRLLSLTNDCSTFSFLSLCKLTLLVHTNMFLFENEDISFVEG